MKLQELENLWNKQADEYNQWCTLGLDEIVEFVQQIEREACASICDEVAYGSEPDDFASDTYRAAATRIRSRS